VSQDLNGNITIGSSKEFVGYDNRVTAGALRQLARKAYGFYPFLSDLNIIRTYAGLRPYTADGLPIVGKGSGPDGFVVAAGHGGDGIALSLITGRVVSELITGRETSLSIEELSPLRFGAKNRDS
jgi:sarcosine oxidase subunit beta